MAPQTPNVPPPAKGMSPQQYYSFLTQQGVPGWAAYDAVQSSYGSGSQNTGNQQANQWGQVAGLVGGSVIGSEIVGGFPTIGGLFSSGGAATGAGAGAGGAAGAGTAGGAAASGTAAGGTAAQTLGASGAAPGGSTLASIGSTALPAAAVIAALSEGWESGGKDILRGRGNKQDWANMGINTIFGAAPNLVSRWLGKPSIGRKLTSGKSDAQLLRDDFRGSLRQAGIADEDYNVTLADGSKFDIGKDGKAKLTNVDGQSTRRYYEVDEANPLAMYAITKIDPIIRAKYNQEAEAAGYRPEQFTAMMVNAVTSNATSQEDVDANIDRIFKAQGSTTPPEQQKPATYQPNQSMESVANATGQGLQSSTQPVDTSGWQFYQDLNSRLRNQGR